MSVSALLLVVLGLGLAGWLFARSRAIMFRRADSKRRIASLPNYHGWYAALWIAVPAIAFIVIWSPVSDALIMQTVLSHPAAANLPPFGLERESILSEARAVAMGNLGAVFNPAGRALVEPFSEAIGRYQLIGFVVTLIAAGLGGAFAFLRLKPDFRARNKVERTVLFILLLASLVAIVTTLGIIASLVFETIRFFGMVSPIDFLFGTHWSPNPMSNPDAVDPSLYGAVPLFWGTLFIGAIIAMIVAIPIGMMSAIYLNQYAPAHMRTWLKPALEVLAGVPTVVYGYFAALTVAPAIRNLALWVGVSNPSSESALAAGLVMGVMIIPFVSSMADDSIAAVPQAMADGSLAMGATKNETIKRVLIPAALPGIVAGVMLAISRAIGETMIVVMAAGLRPNLTMNPLEGMTTVTVKIVEALTGDQEFDSAFTLAAFALGLVLLMVTLTLNIVSTIVVRKFKQRYE